MTDPEKCHNCDYGYTPYCRAENCPGDKIVHVIADLPEKKELQKATFQEVMEMMNRRSGDGL